MSEIRETGGPAFPTPGANVPDHYVEWPASGMELRDYFAARAVSELLRGDALTLEELMGLADYRARLARASYAIADAMLAARYA